MSVAGAGEGQKVILLVSLCKWLSIPILEVACFDLVREVFILLHTATAPQRGVRALISGYESVSVPPSKSHRGLLRRDLIQSRSRVVPSEQIRLLLIRSRELVLWIVLETNLEVGSLGLGGAA